MHWEKAAEIYRIMTTMWCSREERIICLVEADLHIFAPCDQRKVSWEEEIAAVEGVTEEYIEKRDISFKGRVDSYLVERETPGAIMSDFTIPGLKGSGPLVEVYATTCANFTLTPVT